MPSLDLILTAANRAQARGYAHELRQRRRDGALDQVDRALVAPDPGGRRVGSGTATLLALGAVVRRIRRAQRDDSLSAEAALAGRRILLIHSGGDSRRLVAYAAHGKVFTPLPCGDRPPGASALFDLILDDLAAIRWPETGGVVVASGDVLLGIARRALRFRDDRITAIASPGPIEQASRHGVFVLDDDTRVTDVLQKPDEALLRQRGAVDACGRALIDSGLLFIPSRDAAQWLGAAGECGILRPPHPMMDLYADMLPALGSRDSPKPPDDRVQRFLRSLRHAAEERSPRALFAAVVPDLLFFHVGSSRELLDNVTGVRVQDVIEHMRSDRGSVASRLPAKAVVFDSVMAAEAVVRSAAVVQGCWLTQPVTLEGENIVVGVPRSCAAVVHLPPRCGLICLPVGGGDWAAIAFGVDDDFKTPMERGGTLAGRPLDALDRHCWRAADDRTLWSARLWLIGAATQSVEHALRMLKNPIGAGAPLLASAAEIVQHVNHTRLSQHRDETLHESGRRSLVERLLTAGLVCVEEDAASLRHVADAEDVLRRCAGSVAAGVPAIVEARMLRIADAVVRRFPAAKAEWGRSHTDFEQAAFAAVARGVRSDVASHAQPHPAAIRFGEKVRVTAPVRIDLAGGWSDTPPICNEVGGAVVNVAVRLDDQHPIAVEARLIEERLLRIRSVDLGRTIDVADATALAQHRDPCDWAALPKAALALSGIAQTHAEGNFHDWFHGLGGGLELTLRSDLPKGSGLGASSILGAATLTCLARVTGETLTREALIARTSALEQVMSTAGGWQDQAGGITRGAKLLMTSPGAVQVPAEQPLNISESFWSERVLLYSTGMQRLARDILQKVVWRWLGGGADMRRVVARLRAGALRMGEDLRTGDAAGFIDGVHEYWELKKAIDPGATTVEIERLIAGVQPWLSACCLPGAGGGGFLFMIARDADAARDIRAHLGAHPPNGQARLFETRIDGFGLRTTTLA